MEDASRVPLGWLGGLGFIIGGVIFLAAGLLHPHGSTDGTYQESVSSMLNSGDWPAAHWLALISTLILLWAVWLLVDDGWTKGSIVAWAGGRLTIIAMLFMAIQFAVEITAEHAAETYASGGVVPLVELIDPLQTVGWPALGIGLGLLAIGVPKSAPRLVVGLGVIGSLAMIVGGILVMGFHIVAAGPAFAVISLQGIWIIWAGVRIVRSQQPSTTPVPDPAQASRVVTGS